MFFIFTDSANETNIKHLRKRKTKRRSSLNNSKNNVNNVSDSEIHVNDSEKRGEGRHNKSSTLKSSKRLCSSAADYMAHSYEDLILMLIQLQRRQSELVKTGERIRLEMETAEKMSEIEPHYYERYRLQYEQLQQKLAEVEKECEMQTPIIKRIDQMIRVRSKENKSKAASTTFLDQVEQDESSQPSINNHNTSLTKMSQLNKVIPNTNAINTAIDTSDKNIENLRKEQQILENELERVRGLLTHSTKRLEEKAVENAQMEHEMLLARNKLKQVLDAEQREMELTRSSELESELANINQVIDDLHNKREDLNAAIENLKITERAYTDSIRPPNVVAAAAASVHHNTPKVFNANLTFKQTSNPQQQQQQVKHQFNRNEEEDDVMPLYENLNNTKIFLNDQLNNNNSLSSSNPSEENNDDFTLNINLEQTRTPYQTVAAGTSTTSEDSEINNNELRHNLNSMCEFDPSMTFGDSIVDQQIKQIYSYQMNFPMTTAKPANEGIKTVREVKRESERRKFNQQQQTRLTQLLNESLMSYGGGYYYYNTDMINEQTTAVETPASIIAGGGSSGASNSTSVTNTTNSPSVTTLSDGIASKHAEHY